MINVSDKVFQIKYDWGKDSNGKFKTYIVQEIIILLDNKDNYDRGISCYELPNLNYIHYTPEKTWIEVEDFRNSKIEKILSHE